MCSLANLAAALVCGLALISGAGATIVPRLSFEELTDRSELIVTGQVTRSWADWDSSHRFIWTHYELSVNSVHKGAATSSAVLSEPGGVVGGIGQTIAGVVQYQPGEKVVVFLERMPNGYLRTTGWAQGKYTVDASQRVHASGSLAGLDVVETNAARVPPPVSLDGISTAELAARVVARVRAVQGKR